eukprot:TRINITY_DN239_c0_g1_i1.p1 TRINITY_DN239_c0_g1~~TRINITY_DN239_c0_g1_i1.p1  ORF type:complete len:202 (-),score=13.65 TRINITY_DN239_c0_g1_i1:49-654(-)
MWVFYLMNKAATEKTKMKRHLVVQFLVVNYTIAFIFSFYPVLKYMDTFTVSWRACYGFSSDVNTDDQMNMLLFVGEVIPFLESVVLLILTNVRFRNIAAEGDMAAYHKLYLCLGISYLSINMMYIITQLLLIFNVNLDSHVTLIIFRITSIQNIPDGIILYKFALKRIMDEESDSDSSWTSRLLMDSAYDSETVSAIIELK